MAAEFATDYSAVRHENVTDETLRVFFGEGGYRQRTFPNSQSFDFDGLTGRVLSSS